MTQISFETYVKQLKGKPRGPKIQSDVETELLTWIRNIDEIPIFPTQSHRYIKYSKKGLKTVKKFSLLFARILLKWEIARDATPLDDIETDNWEEWE